MEGLIEGTPGANNAEFTLSLVSYETDEVHFSRGHQVWFEDKSRGYSQRESAVLRLLGPEELASEEEHIRTEMVRRASVACRFGDRGHLNGYIHTNNRKPECGTLVKPSSVVIHAGAKIRLTIQEGSPGWEKSPVILEARDRGWTCHEIVELRIKGERESQQELLGSNPGSLHADFTLKVEIYTTEEVHLIRGHEVCDIDVDGL